MQHGLGVCLLLAASLSSALAQQHATGFLDRAIDVNGVTYRYQVFVPHKYHPEARWPVILFLHGAGERGRDGLLQTEVGLGSAVRRHPDWYPAIIVFPQAPEGALWSDAPATAAVAALDRTLAEFSVDPARVYLTGLSMGGNGTWYLAYKHPERFAALVPICSWVAGNSRFRSFLPESSRGPYAEIAQRIPKVPVWIVHGETDEIVPVSESRQLAEALKAAGNPVKYTELPGVGHNSWDAAYGSPSLARWLFQQRRP